MQGAVDFFLTSLSRVYAAVGQLPEEATSGQSVCDVSILSKVARQVLKGPVDSCCEAVLTLSDRLHKVADTKSQTVAHSLP